MSKVTVEMDEDMWAVSLEALEQGGYGDSPLANTLRSAKPAADPFEVDWSLAPTINGQPAMYHTWQENGQQTWYTVEPELGYHYWNANGPYTHEHFITNWRESLRRRTEGA
jgi:hypothetical protein